MRISNYRHWYVGILFFVLLFSSLSSSLPACTGCEDMQQPIYDSAVVDGNPNEWIRADDFYMNMYRAWKPTKDVLSEAYLRYDCAANVLYVMVEKATSYPILAQDGDEVYVKIDGDKKVSSDDEGRVGQPTFQWINKSGSYADGWEASFYIEEGLYEIIIHNNVWDGEEQTSGTDKGGVNLCIECPGIDYGDAPNDGALYLYGSASHKIISGLTVFMGSVVDDDPSYSGDVNAGTDDNSDGTDDEDGITFYIQNTDGTWSLVDGSEFYKGRTYKVVVDVQLECETAKLAAWFDFFIDGEFGNEAEEIIIDNETIENTSGGVASIQFVQPFMVPGGSSEGTTYLRFRLDCQSDDLPPTGLGHVAGEVEDYVTNIGSEPPVAVTLTSFSAIRSENGVLVEWKAASEIGNAGYNLSKSVSESGAWTKINEILIAVPENAVQTSGQHYKFIDENPYQTLSYYRLEALALDGTSEYYGPVQITQSSGVEDQQMPNEFALEQNYPNPFNPNTTIEYTLPEPTSLSIVIFDLQGKIVKTLVDGMQTAGRHSAIWDATNQFGEPVPSGLYIYRMQASQFTKMNRMTLLK